MVISRHFQVEALQAQRGLPGVGVHHEYRQAGGKGTFAQLGNASVHLIGTGQQDRADLNAVHRSQTGGNQHVRTVSGGHQQGAWAEVLQHVRNAARTEGHGLHAAGVDVAFVNDGGIQVFCHIDCAGSNQVEAPRNGAQHRQGAGCAQLSRIDADHFRFGGVIEDLREIRASTALLINRGVQFVNDHAGDVGVLHAAETVAGQLDTLFQLLLGIGTLRHHKDDLGVQRFGDFEVQRLGKLVFTGRDQAFNQHHFRVFRAFVIAGDDLFHQHVFLVAGEQRLNVAHLQRLSGRQIGVRTHDRGGLVWRIATGTRLGDRFKDAQTNAFAFHSTDHAQADAGQADAGSGRDQHNNTGHGISSFSLPPVIWRDTKQHRQRWLAVWNQAVRRLASWAITSSSLVGMTIARVVPSLLI